MGGGGRGSFSVSLHCCVEIGSPTETRVHQLARLAGQRSPGIPLSLPTPSKSGTTGGCCCDWLFM